MILAGVRSLLIVGEHRPGILSGAFLLEVIEAIANLLEEILGGKRPAVGQGHERPVEREHIGVARMLVQIGSDQPLGLVEIAAMKRRPHRLEPRDVRGAASEQHEAGHDDGKQAGAWHGSTRRPIVRADWSRATDSSGCGGSP